MDWKHYKLGDEMELDIGKLYAVMGVYTAPCIAKIEHVGIPEGILYGGM